MISDHTVTQLAAGCCRLVNSRLLCATRQGSSHIDRCMLALIDVHVNSFHDCLWSVATLGAFSVDIKMPNLHRLAKLSQVLLSEFALIPLGQPHCKMIQPCKTVIFGFTCLSAYPATGNIIHWHWLQNAKSMTKRYICTKVWKPNMDNFLNYVSISQLRFLPLQSSPHCLGSHSAFSGWNLISLF